MKMIYKRPITSFFIALALLVISIVAVNRLATKPQTESRQEIVKEVEFFDPEKENSISILGQVTESPVLTIVSSGAGVITEVSVSEGKSVTQGQELAVVSTNYAGDSVQELQKRLAELQFDSTTQGVGRQKDAINLQKELAELDPTVVANKILLKQLEAQEFGIELGRDTAPTQLKLAELALEATRPKSPSKGTIEKLYVSPLDTVIPGSPIATIRREGGVAKVTALIPKSLKSMVASGTSKVTFNGSEATASLTNLSSSPVNGTLYGATFTLNSTAAKELLEGTFVKLTIPIVSTKNSFFIPIESVHQTETSTVVFVESEGFARGKTIEVGEVVGNLVEVKSGLTKEERLIISRNVIEGDRVRS